MSINRYITLQCRSTKRVTYLLLISTIPILSVQRLNIISHPDLWEYDTEELARFTPLRKFSSSTNTSAVWSDFKIHTSKEKGYADIAWCDYCHKPFSREYSTLSRHIERHHKDQIKSAEVSGICAAQETKDHFNSEKIAARAVFYIANLARSIKI